MPRLQSRKNRRPSFRPAESFGPNRALGKKICALESVQLFGGLADSCWAESKEFALEKAGDEYPTFLEALVLGEMISRKNS